MSGVLRGSKYVIKNLENNLPSTPLARKKPLNNDFLLAGVLEMENKQDRDAIRKAKTLYSSCMNESKSHSNTSLMTCVFCMRQRIMQSTGSAQGVNSKMRNCLNLKPYFILLAIRK